MEEKKTSAFSNGLIWFGAAVSIAEILTGTLMAPLGFAKGLAAILIGHVIGCILLFFAGLIGGQTGKSAMETVALSFGQKGAYLFAALNVLQLVGWTAVMIANGASTAGAVLNLGGNWVWSVIIGALIILWIVIGIRNLGKLNTVSMGAAVSADHRHEHRGVPGRRKQSCRSVVHHVRSCRGTVGGHAAVLAPPDLGLHQDRPQTVPGHTDQRCGLFSRQRLDVRHRHGRSLFTGEGDVAAIMVKAGMGAAALIIILFSTVTTTFLDAYSAGVSAVSLPLRLKEKPAAILVAIIGILLAVFTPVTQFETFLYLIGSVFAPMIAIQITDYFILKRNTSDKPADYRNLFLWLAGFLFYRLLMRVDLPLGNTLPDMLLTGLLCIAANQLFGGKKHAE